MKPKTKVVIARINSFSGSCISYEDTTDPLLTYDVFTGSGYKGYLNLIHRELRKYYRTSSYSGWIEVMW